MNKIVYFTSNRNRKNKYLLSTEIFKKNGKLKACKRAIHPEAQNHIDGLIDNFKTVLELTQDTNLSPCRALKVGADVEFDFIEGKTVERSIIESLLNDNYKEASDMLGSYIDALGALKSTTVDPTSSKAYIETFGSVYKGKQECLAKGVIDLNLDNAIISGDQWILFDYEWVFDFPIPKAFVRARILYYLLTRHQEIFAYHYTRLKCVTIDGILVPGVIYEGNKKSFALFNKFVKSERAFQRFVGATFAPEFSRTSFNPSSIERRNPTPGVESKIESLRKDTSDQELMLSKARLEISKLNEVNSSLEREISKIANSKSYKLARRISRIKNFGNR